jgi:Flp pilus assembly pilin Flp
MLWNFLREEEGQDLIEYTLLLAFVALAVAALFGSMRTTITDIWTSANSSLTEAKGGSS